MLRNRFQPRGAYDVINTTDIYSLLWRLPRLADYVVAVAPTSILHHIKPTQCWTACAYIINVVPREVCYNTIPKRRSSPQGVTCGHWIVLIIGGEKNELFDPLGPGIVDGSERDYGHEMTDFVKLNNCHAVNDELLDIKNCGFFCLLFCYYKCRGYTSEEAVKKLKKYKLNIVAKCERVFFS